MRTHVENLRVHVSIGTDSSTRANLNVNSRSSPQESTLHLVLRLRGGMQIFVKTLWPA